MSDILCNDDIHLIRLGLKVSLPLRGNASHTHCNATSIVSQDYQRAQQWSFRQILSFWIEFKLEILWKVDERSPSLNPKAAKCAIYSGAGVVKAEEWSQSQ